MLPTQCFGIGQITLIDDICIFITKLTPENLLTHRTDNYEFFLSNVMTTKKTLSVNLSCKNPNLILIFYKITRPNYQIA